MFFFFKQKTAYEMRISDWSSDVCSSDLERDGSGNGFHRIPNPESPIPAFRAARPRGPLKYSWTQGWSRFSISDSGPTATTFLSASTATRSQIAYRSEEHTSELQSLMRISYAVFCLKKKK